MRADIDLKRVQAKTEVSKVYIAALTAVAAIFTAAGVTIGYVLRGIGR